MCKKCAANRLRLFDNSQKRRKNIVINKDPKIQDLDKYYRYKNFESINKIKTKFSNSNEELEIIVGPFLENDLKNLIPPYKESEKKKENKNGLSDINYFHDQDYFLPKSENGLIFPYPINSSYARQVSLIDDYKFEYGSNFQINQRRHYSSYENNDHEFLGYEPAQLTL